MKIKNKIMPIRQVMTGALTLSLVAVVSASVVYINSKADSNQITDILESSNTTENIDNTESSVEDIEFEKVNNIIDKSKEMYSELIIHSDEKPVYSRDEIYARIDEGEKAYNNKITNKIDVAKYTENTKKLNTLSNDEINNIENKSLIYHLMINSVDYYNTVEGKVIDAMVIENPVTLDFYTNISEQYAYCLSSQNGEKVSEEFVENYKQYTVNLKDNTCRTAYIGEPVEFTMNDNDRSVILSDDGQNFSVYRNDITNIGHPASVCIFPQGVAFKYISDFDLWNISGKESLLDRDCFVIEGNIKNSDETFRMYIDDCTGILLKYESYSNSGEITGFVETKSIKIDEPLTKKSFDASNYIERPFSLNEEMNNTDEIQN